MTVFQDGMLSGGRTGRHTGPGKGRGGTKRGSPAAWTIFYFCGWGNPDILTMSDMPIVSRKLSQVMWFEYESTAQEVAEVLGDGWHVIDATPEEDSGSNRILNAIFGKDDDCEMKQGQD